MKRTIVIPPFSNPDGAILSSVKVTFQLVDANRKKIIGYADDESIIDYAAVTVPGEGVDVELSPQTDIAPESYWLVTVRSQHSRATYLTQLADSDEPIGFRSFIEAGAPVDPADLLENRFDAAGTSASAISAHLAAYDHTPRGSVDSVADTIRRESVLQYSESYRPLPLVSVWADTQYPPTNQIALLAGGVPILPCVRWTDRSSEVQYWIDSDQRAAVQSFARMNLPITMLYAQQWDADFYLASDYTGLSLNSTGCGEALNGTKMSKLSPLGPSQPWYDLGKKWAQDEIATAVQALYPFPPKVILVDNNEPQKLYWTEAETEKRYVDLYGTGTTDTQKISAFSAGWTTNISALANGLKDGLTTWKNVVVSRYSAFAPDHIGRWSDWPANSSVTATQLDWSWNALDGGVIECYDNHWETSKTAYNYWSMQCETMTLVPAKAQAYAANPDYWMEMIFWDGYYTPATEGSQGATSKSRVYDAAGISYTDTLFKGWVQYCLWLLNPRVARYYFDPGSHTDQTSWFQAIIDPVRAVHDNETLQRFWRSGTLVANTAKEHPWQTNLPAQLSGVHRWFHLTTNKDPSSPELTTTWPVWTLGYLLGTTPNREWLIYAHAPAGAQSNVVVTIPGYQDVTLSSVAIGGSWYLVSESGGTVTGVSV